MLMLCHLVAIRPLFIMKYTTHSVHVKLPPTNNLNLPPLGQNLKKYMYFKSTVVYHPDHVFKKKKKWKCQFLKKINHYVIDLDTY